MIVLSFVLGVTIGSSHVGAQQSSSIPSWVKNTALWWGQGQIGDGDFIKAIQWMIDNGLIHISSQAQQNQAGTVTSAQNSTIFAPCTEVNLNVPSSCLAHYLPVPSDIGTSWSSHNGIDIPQGINSPVLAQMVRQDFENTSTKPIEIFDVWIQEYQPPAKGLENFKQDEKEMAVGATKFFGNAASNDTSLYAYAPTGQAGQVTSRSLSSVPSS